MKQIILAFVLLLSATLWAQDKSITGMVYDQKTKEPVMGAVISLQNKPVATTNIDGEFSLKCQANAILQITHQSYETKKINAKDGIKIALLSKNVSLDEVIIKANPLEDITHSVVVMDDVKKGSQPRNVADLFHDIPGFGIQKRSASAMEPSLRSFKYEQMNIKYDGGNKMVNACPNRMDPITAHVIPESVRKIEVVKGPFTVRFGQVFGGVVNMVTRQPTPDDYGWHGDLQTGYETNGNNLVLRADLMYAAKKFDINIDAEHRDFGDYTDGDGFVTPSGFTTDSYSVKMAYNPNKNQRLQVNWQQKFSRDIKHAGLMMDSPIDDSYLVGLDYKIKKVSKKVKYVQFKSYYSFVDHLMTNGYEMDVTRPNYPGTDARTPVTSNTMGGKFEVALTPKKGWLIYTGLDADIIMRDGTKTIFVNNNPATGAPFDPVIVKKLKVWQDSYINDFGVFVEANRKLSDNYYMTMGLRSDYVSSDSQDPATGFTDIYGEVATQTDITLGGNISIKYKKNGFQTQLAYGRGTRTPSMIERYIYRFIVGRDSREYIGNPYLKPEINNQVEWSVQKKWDKIQVGTNLFYSYLQDYITPVINSALTSTEGGCGGGAPQAPKVFRNVNAYQYGFDAFLAYKINDNWLLKTDLAFTHAYNTTLSEPLAQVAPANAHFEIKYEKNNYWIDLRSEIVSKQFDYAPSFLETETPGHSTIDLRIGWKPYKGLSIGAAALNITDQAYYNHLNFGFVNADENNGRRIFEPGRSFSTFIKYKF
jgi:iron complex outermembrane receptor protein